MRWRDRCAAGNDINLRKGVKPKVRDRYLREIDYLRISVTDRCNLRCRYCMPEGGVESICHSDILTYEEILRLIKIVAKMGICKIKITGGEPLVRKDVCGFIRKIHEIPGINSVTLTTNGSLLGQYLPELEAAGISGINISLDTLDADKFYQITRRDSFIEVWDSFRKVIKTKIPVKINCVPMRGFNDEELVDIALLAKEFPVSVRFIEMMPIGKGREYQGISQKEVEEMLESVYGEMTSVSEAMGNGPAKYYNLPGFQGKIGFISAISHEFCRNCNRIRLTADGILKPCLNYESHVDLRKAMRNAISDRELEQLVRKSIYEKPKCHGFGIEKEIDRQEKQQMVRIGG